MCVRDGRGTTRRAGAIVPGWSGFADAFRQGPLVSSEAK
jgi:hypothetical protein